MNMEQLTISSKKDIEELNDDLYIAPLHVKGAISCDMGIKIGFSDKCIPGLIIYDGLNFIGFNKNGWTLLSNNYEYIELKHSIKDNNLSLDIDIDDDINFKYTINDDIDNVYINLNKMNYYKTNNINILLINNLKKDMRVIFNNDIDIFYSNNISKNDIKILKNNIIKFNVDIIDKHFLISYNEFSQ